jgi:hypothetical protein
VGLSEAPLLQRFCGNAVAAGVADGDVREKL